jgi:DNA polymerase-3 subunit beta
MKSFKLHSDTLLRPLQAVSGIVERRHTLPILSHVLLKLSRHSISVMATDLQMQITQSGRWDTEVDKSAAESAENGEVVDDAEHAGNADLMAVTLPARKLLDILRAIPAGDIKLSRSATQLTLRCGKSRFSLQTLSVDEFPSLAPAAPGETRLSLPQKDFRQMLQRVHFAMAQQDIRHFMNGLQLRIEASQLSAVALDGHRLAWASLKIEETGVPQEAIVPRKTVLELLRLLADSEEPLQIELGREQIRFAFGAIELRSKLIDGRFPDAQRAIPRHHPHCLTIAREPWLKALQRAAILSAEKFKSVRFLFEPGQMTLISNNAERDEAEEGLDIVYDGAALEISFNATYLLDVLGHLDSHMVDLRLDPAGLSALITMPDNPRYKYVAMALRN